MAKSKDQLEKELEVISEKTRSSYDALHGTGASGDRGLYRELGIAKQDFEKSDPGTDYRKTAQEKITRLTAEIKKAEATYKKYQDQKNALNKELKAVKKAETTAKTKATTAKTAGTLYDKALAELQTAELGIEGYKGQEKYITAYRKAEAAFKSAVDSGVTPKQSLPIAKITIPPVEAGTGETGSKTGEVKEPTPTEFIALITDPKNKNLLIDVQKDLAKNFGYKGPVDGSPSADFLPALQIAYTQRGSLPEAWRGTDFRSFLANPIGGGKTGGTGGAGGTSITNYISDETQAAAAIQGVFNTVLGREATAKEVGALTKILVDAQKKNPYKTTNGVRTGGLDDQQFLTDLIKTGTYEANKKAYPGILSNLAEEAKTKKAGKEEKVALGNRQSIVDTAFNNGIKLSEDQINGYLAAIKAGKSIDQIQQDIRSMNSLGMPDSIKKLIDAGNDLNAILSPYRRAMAASLGINENTIDMNDPTLRKAIGPDKEMSLYDFNKAIRQDNRWKYSEEANDEVTNMINQVKRDFGFMG